MSKKVLFLLCVLAALLLSATPVFASSGQVSPAYPASSSHGGTYAAQSAMDSFSTGSYGALNGVYMFQYTVFLKCNSSGWYAEEINANKPLTLVQYGTGFNISASDGGSFDVWKLDPWGATQRITQSVTYYRSFATGSDPYVSGSFGTAAYLSASVPVETWDYQALLSVYRRDSLISWIQNPIIYNVQFTVNKVVKNSTDAADLTPITGKMYFDQSPNLLYTFWGKNDPLSIVQNNDPSFPQQATSVPDHYKGSYGSGDMYGQLFSSPVVFRFVPDDSRYKTLAGSFDPTKMESSQVIQHNEWGTPTSAPDYGTTSGQTVLTVATPTTGQTVQPMVSDASSNSVSARVQTLQYALNQKAPFAWWSQINSNANGSVDSSAFGIYWALDDKGEQTGFTISSAPDFRAVSYVVLGATALIVAYSEIRRWLG